VSSFQPFVQGLIDQSILPLLLLCAPFLLLGGLAWASSGTDQRARQGAHSALRAVLWGGVVILFASPLIATLIEVARSNGLLE
jgi:hypothetical protein